MEKYYERPIYRTTDDLLSRYVAIFPGCAATVALKATSGKGATQRWTIASSDGESTDAGNWLPSFITAATVKAAGRQRPSSAVWNRWRAPKRVGAI